ncbi:tripartite tricarboxylate transporter substrate-binding protein [Ramlibacter henchirensis]|uniref:tripartite tricarboxylate transporter substrate-binding protein n=1 Tax=Ramlibacter henchirensis TaxID=204072 RepID=UPI0030B8BADB
MPNFNVQVWRGLYAPRGTPPAVLAKLNAALRAALKDPELVKRQEALGPTGSDNPARPCRPPQVRGGGNGALEQGDQEAGEFAD